MSPIVQRLLNQQLVCPQFGTPAEVVEYMGAMQAQEYRMMRWAVAMRTRKPSAKAFKKAFDSGQIIRLHLLRGTWQLVAADDYWPLLELCAPKALTVINGWMRNNKISLPDDEVARVREILVRTAADKGSVTKEDFVQALAEHDIRMDDHRLSYHIRYAELSGTLCSGDLQPMKATYALAADKVKNRLRMDRDEAIMMLARKYFRSRQPATLEDFVWWSGLNIGDCRRAVEMLGDYIHVEMHGRASAKREFYYTDDCRTRGFRKGRCLFIPPYDEYLIGYKSRD
ncbi:MAG: AlkZ family DNA glycosylase, partial [Bacteroidales bacterium]|nr:AlkZ family DNA glycosylase [Bacteroidales bacterium]